MTAVRADGLTFTYPAAPRPALDRVSLELRAGEVSWLTGPLGAGTSTFLLACAGIAPRVTGGTRGGALRVLGGDPAQAATATGRVAFLSASPAAQLSGVTESVYDEIAFGPANFGWARDRIDAEVRAAADRMGVVSLLRRDPRTLSGGETQRVMLAAFAVLSPALWLLDEPGAALDASGLTRLAGLLRAEAARGAAVVLTAEDAGFGLAVADRLVVFAAGRPVLDGAPRDLLAGEAIWQAGAAGAPVAELARDAAALGTVPALAAPYPVDVDEAIARWRMPWA